MRKNFVIDLDSGEEVNEQFFFKLPKKNKINYITDYRGFHISKKVMKLVILLKVIALLQTLLVAHVCTYCLHMAVFLFFFSFTVSKNGVQACSASFSLSGTSQKR